MHRPPKPEIAGSNPATPAIFWIRAILKGAQASMGQAMSTEDEGDALSALPDPYGHGFARTEDPIERTTEKWLQQERLRLRFGTLARNPFLLGLRLCFGSIVAVTALISVLLPEYAPPNPGYVLLFGGIPFLLATVPALMAGEAMWQSIQARISLREIDGEATGGKLSLRSQPGMDRILEGLTDVRRHNSVNTLLALSSIFLLGLGTVITEESIVWSLSFLVSMTLGLAHTFHAYFTYDSVRQQGDLMPCLVHHSPTHHPTQLGSILGELIVLHLDPDLYLDWLTWLNDFRDSILPGYDKDQSWERVLYILHLHAKGDLSDSIAHGELSEFIRPDAMGDVLLNPEAKFNWRSLQRLLAHARVWQPSAFRLLERLQLDLLSGSPMMIREPWRMDVALDPQCDEGTGHLFIALNNQTFKQTVARIEVVCPGGEPFARDHRFELKACPPPRQAVELYTAGEDDALDWVPRYLQQGVVLWLGVAWPEKEQGDRYVQVILRDEEGVVIESRVLRTVVKRRNSSHYRKKNKRLEGARKWAARPLPEF